MNRCKLVIRLLMKRMNNFCVADWDPLDRISLILVLLDVSSKARQVGEIMDIRLRYPGLVLHASPSSLSPNLHITRSYSVLYFFFEHSQSVCAFCLIWQSIPLINNSKPKLFFLTSAFACYLATFHGRLCLTMKFYWIEHCKPVSVHICIICQIRIRNSLAETDLDLTNYSGIFGFFFFINFLKLPTNSPQAAQNYSNTILWCTGKIKLSLWTSYNWIQARNGIYVGSGTRAVLLNSLYCPSLHASLFLVFKFEK